MAGEISLAHQGFNAAGWEGSRLAGWRSGAIGLHIPGWIISGLFSVRFFAILYFQQHGRVRFGFVFSTDAILKDFSGSFLGSFRLTCVAFSFVFNNLSASFLKNKYFLSHAF
ncbi:MAG TPA: hypothetical protein VFL79_03480 [Terriglobia bacterium]|nr:hypothetical protein [Terriglobia bacterium]